MSDEWMVSARNYATWSRSRTPDSKRIPYYRPFDRISANWLLESGCFWEFRLCFNVLVHELQTNLGRIEKWRKFLKFWKSLIRKKVDYRRFLLAGSTSDAQRRNLSHANVGWRHSGGSSSQWFPACSTCVLSYGKRMPSTPSAPTGRTWGKTAVILILMIFKCICQAFCFEVKLGICWILWVKWYLLMHSWTYSYLYAFFSSKNLHVQFLFIYLLFKFDWFILRVSFYFLIHAAPICLFIHRCRDMYRQFVIDLCVCFIRDIKPG